MATRPSSIKQTSTWDNILISEGWLKQLVRVGLIAVALLCVVAGSAVIGLTEYGLYVILGLVGVIIGALIVLRPHTGMYIVVIFFYMNLSWIATDQFGIPSLNRPLIALVAAAVLVTRFILQREKLIFRRTEGIIIAYAVVLGISSILGQHIESETTSGIVDLAKDIVLMLVILQLAYREDVIKNTQWILIVCASFISSVTLFQFLTRSFNNTLLGLSTWRDDSVGGTQSIDFMRAGGQVGEPNFFAQALIMVYPIALYRALTSEKTHEKVFGWICTGLIVGAIILSYSRAAFVILIIITVMILLERRIDLFNLVLAGSIIFFVSLPILPDGYVQRLLSLSGADGRTDVSLQGRTSEALVAFEMFGDYPLLGIGYGVYEENYLNYSAGIGLDSRYENREAHSLYLEALAETGLIGTGMLALMLAAIFLRLRHSLNDLSRIGRADLKPWVKGLMFGSIAYLLTSIFLHDAFSSYLRMSLALTLSTTVLIDRLVARYEEQRKIQRARETYLVQ